MNAQSTQAIKPYTIQELEAKYGKMGALVIWQMRQQQVATK